MLMPNTFNLLLHYSKHTERETTADGLSQGSPKRNPCAPLAEKIVVIVIKRAFG